MVGLEILSAIIATSTAKTVIKFLDDKVADYVNRKFGNKPPNEIETLKKQVDELKVKVEAKEKSEITQTDIEEIGKTITEIKERQSSLPDPIISDLSFQEWSEKNLDIEDQAPIVVRKLGILIDKAKELKISERKRREIQDMTIAIDMNFKDMMRAMDRARRFRLTIDEEKARAAEIALRDTIIEAGILFESYYSSK